MARTVTVEQGYALVNELYAQSTGQKAVTVVDDGTFTAVASGVKKLTDNQIYKGLTEMLRRLVISIRPYTAPFRLNWADESAYGAHVYKVSYLDNAAAEENPAWELADGDTLGTHTVKLGRTYEADIWGENTIMAHVTITMDQIKTALNTPALNARFWSGLMTNIENQMEQQREAMCRSNIMNLVGGVYSYKDTEDPDLAYMKENTVHLVTEYNAKFNPSKPALTLQAIMADPVKYAQFIKFVFARMNYLVKLMGNRDGLHHMNPFADPKLANLRTKEEKTIMRHSAPEDLRCYLNFEYMKDLETQVLTTVWNMEYLKMMPHEEVLYWQAIKNPTSMAVNPLVMGKDGKTSQPGPQTINNLFGVIYDKDAAGVGVVADHEGDTPYDVERGAFNRYWRKEVKSWNDFTENCVVLLMD